MDLLHLHEIKNKMIGNYISSVEYYTSIIKNTSDMDMRCAEIYE